MPTSSFATLDELAALRDILNDRIDNLQRRLERLASDFDNPPHVHAPDLIAHVAAAHRRAAPLAIAVATFGPPPTRGRSSWRRLGGIPPPGPPPAAAIRKRAEHYSLPGTRRRQDLQGNGALQPQPKKSTAGREFVLPSSVLALLRQHATASNNSEAERAAGRHSASIRPYGPLALRAIPPMLNLTPGTLRLAEYRSWSRALT